MQSKQPELLEKQQLVHDNMINIWMHLSGTNLLTVNKTGNCCYSYASVPGAFFNTVLTWHYHSEEIHLITKLDKLYQERHLSYGFLVYPDENASALKQQLLAHQLTMDCCVQGMYMSLSSAEYKVATPDNVTIKSVNTLNDLDDWIYPVKTGFSLTEDGAYVYKKLNKKILDENIMHHFVAFQHEKPVSTCSLFLDKQSQSAGVYNCATVPEARKQGIATALIKHGLFYAHEKGYDSAVLQADPDSQNLFKKIGFEVCTVYEAFIKKI